MANCFNIILNKLQEGKKVLAHCTEGCDRTGTLFFVLEALLGVSESDLAKDYELSSFYFYPRQRNGIYASPDYDHTYGYGDYRGMIERIKNDYEGATINEKVENMMLSLGVTPNQISLFRDIMLDEDSSKNTEDGITVHKNDSKKTSRDIYNMHGVRLNKKQSGVNIMNGRKYYISQE